MITTSFDYHRPGTVDEAIALLQQFGDEAKLIAGGHSLLPVMKTRLAQPGVLIDIGRVAGLRGISQTNGTLSIGATTTHAEIAASALLQQLAPALAECATLIGDIQVRNRGTLGGSLAHADPAADMPAVILALSASIIVAGPNGRREIAADDMFVDMLQTALGPDELLVEVRIPAAPAGSASAYVKFPHPASRYAVVGAAAYLQRGNDGMISAARVAVTGAGPKAERQGAVEQALIGTPADAAAIGAAAEQCALSDYLSDIHASAEYRAAMTRVYVRRAISAAAARLG